MQRTVRIPADLATELARVTSMAQGGSGRWRGPMTTSTPFCRRWRMFCASKRVEAEALADGGDLYDALIDDYEPGDDRGGAWRAFSTGCGRGWWICAPGSARRGGRRWRFRGHFPRDVQLALSREIALAFGYDLNTGRIDLAVHPFSSGSGADVRITTRVDETDPLGCLYSNDPRGRACGLRAEHRARLRAERSGARRLHGRARKPEPDLREPACAFGPLHRLALWPNAGAFRRYRGRERRGLPRRGEQRVLGPYPDRGRRGALQPAHHAAL